MGFSLEINEGDFIRLNWTEMAVLRTVLDSAGVLDEQAEPPPERLSLEEWPTAEEVANWPELWEKPLEMPFTGRIPAYKLTFNEAFSVSREESALIADALESCLRAEGDILGLDGDDDCRPFLGFVAKFCRRAAGGDGFSVS